MAVTLCIVGCVQHPRGFYALGAIHSVPTLGNGDNLSALRYSTYPWGGQSILMWTAGLEPCPSGGTHTMICKVVYLDWGLYCRLWKKNTQGEVHKTQGFIVHSREYSSLANLDCCLLLSPCSSLNVCPACLCFLVSLFQLWRKLLNFALLFSHIFENKFQ